MKKILLITAMMILLVLPLVLANSLGSVEPIDWKTKVLTIKEDGVYDGVSLVKDKDKAEIWIDKKVGDVYHVDSLVNTDTKVNVELFYDIQPDEIYYRSHNGKYEKYVTWTWVDKLICEKGLDYCGGYALISNVDLEYATGSNTFTAAISGATWQNDGVVVTLVADTDYTQSASTFTIKNINYAWGEVNIGYDYTTLKESQQGINKTIVSISKIPTWLSLIIIISIVGILLAIVLNILPKYGFKSGEVAEI